jgi:hypothetical protein
MHDLCIFLAYIGLLVVPVIFAARAGRPPNP